MSATSDGSAKSTGRPIQREILPIPDQQYTGLITYDAKDPDAKFPPITPLRPPAGAPNVLIVLLDDVGFGASSAFGGPCQTATADRMAAEGLRYSRFHTTALCSPTRAALLTGRNHHAVGMGGITEMATAAPGYTSIIPNSAAPLAKTLKLNGYATAQFGKCHEVPVWETSSAGPFDHWPTGSGFEHFYGFVGGETNQYYPLIYDGTRHIEPSATPEQGYHFMTDMTDNAIAWVRQQKLLMPDKPFFMYFAPGATHAPHQVPKEWIDKYRGKFDQGWDVLREETLARQKQLGVVPQDCELTPRPAGIPAWRDEPDDMKPILARQMEVYAAFLEFTDHHVGRLIDAIAQLEVLDNTLVYYIIGDNGASAEGTLNGTFSEVIMANGASALETPEFMSARIGEFGGPKAYNHYAVGWAHAMDTPYQWTKQVASHFGGTRNGTIIRWPRGVNAKGEVRDQFHHVIDVASTVLDVAGLPEPVMVEGVAQVPLQGSSMRYSFDDADAPERHETQYFEMFGNRGIYHKGWTAVTRHRTPWVVMGGAPAFDDDVWELYDTTIDWSQAHNLAREMPQKLHELQRLWLIEAARYNVLPMDDRVAERFNSDLAGRPELVRGTKQLLAGGMGALNESTVLNVKNKSHSVTAQIVVPDGTPANGVILSQGGAFGGWALYAKDGRLAYVYNFLGLERYVITSAEPIPAGKHQVRMEFAYDGGGIGKGGTVTLYIDGKTSGSGRVDHTMPLIFSADETTEVGRKSGSPISPDMPLEQSTFNGSVILVQIDIGPAETDHLVSREDVLAMLMAYQ